MADEEKIITCPITKKRLKRKKRYYRDGAFYYNKASWKKAADAKAKEAEASAAEEGAQE